MENLFRIILCCNALVSLVAVNSFFFAVISPANCTHFMLIVEAVLLTLPSDIETF
jgi:hypothetical protein